MVGSVVVVLVLSAAPVSVAVRGEPPAIAERRARPRPTFSFAPVAGFGLSVGNNVSGPAAQLGFGLALEVGAIIRDRAALTVQLMGAWVPATADAQAAARALGMVLYGSIMTGGGPSFDWYLSDHWTVGSGTHLFVAVGSLRTVSLMVPFRVSWRPGEREPEAVARRGFVFGLQLGLGFGLNGLNSASSAQLTGTALLTAGYGWW